ncbi:MAG: FKBP-type peptidyl-prolyl cis-trans isomerase [Ignavibacteria bacterium]|nr:FKBP-type peptidyl-prolyl cis-trans isomerase [Ignavibacteria bacterium]
MRLFVLFVLIASLVFVSCRTSKVGSSKEENWRTTPSGLQYSDVYEGRGEMPKPRQRVTINFIMKLEDGTIIEDTYKSGIPMTFTLGNKDAIEGLEEGVSTMRVGGKRILIIPPELGFGAHSYRGIPPNSKLIIEVELVKVE